jgi:hypothetical protein
VAVAEKDQAGEEGHVESGKQDAHFGWVSGIIVRGKAAASGLRGRMGWGGYTGIMAAADHGQRLAGRTTERILLDDLGTCHPVSLSFQLGEWSPPCSPMAGDLNSGLAREMAGGTVGRF